MKYFEGWQGKANIFDLLADVANLIGVGTHIIISWLPIVLKPIADAILTPLTFVADPLIYCFRSIARTIKYIGRNYYHAKFEAEELSPDGKPHPLQKTADIATILIFALAIASFFLLFPYHSLFAWGFGSLGISVNIYFDHKLPENIAKAAFKSESKNEKARTLYMQRYYSTRLYCILLLIIALFLILGAPSLGLPVWIAKSSSILLLGMNILRAVNGVSPETFNKCCPPLLRPDLKSEETSAPAPSKLTSPLKLQPSPSPEKEKKPSYCFTLLCCLRDDSLPDSKFTKRGENDAVQHSYRQGPPL